MAPSFANVTPCVDSGSTTAGVRRYMQARRRVDGGARVRGLPGFKRSSRRTHLCLFEATHIVAATSVRPILERCILLTLRQAWVENGIVIAVGRGRRLS